MTNFKNGGKYDVGSPKWIANKMKSKGLQKLRWYCQMCEKQCRDENGFKCHRMSEGHQRMMKVFIENPNKFMDDFSQEFEAGFMKLMSTTYCGTRVLANTVYCTYIHDREHLHMNGTIWVTLGNFVQYLGRTGQCKIDKTPKGWYLEWIDRSPEKLQREKEKAEKEKSELAEEERHEQQLLKAIKMGKQLGGDEPEYEATALQRENEDEVIAFGMVAKSSSSQEVKPMLGNVFASLGGAGEKRKREGGQKSMSVLDQIKQEHESKKLKEAESADWWVQPGLIVKVMDKVADGKYYKKKAEIIDVHDRYTAEVSMNDSGDVLRLDQEMLETVIPQEGGKVMIVKGRNRELKGTLHKVDMANFCCAVMLSSGDVIDNLQWEEICKMAKK